MKRKINAKRVASALFLLLWFRNSIFVLASPSYADFYNLLPFLNEVSAINDVFRTIFWGIVFVLRWLINGAETGINYMIMMPNHFFSSEQMTTLINAVNIIFLAFIPLSLMWVGYKIIYLGANSADAFKKAIKSTFVALGVMVGATWILSTGMQLVARSTVALDELTSDFSGTVVDVKILNSFLDLEHAYNFGLSFMAESRDMINTLQSIDLDHLDFNKTANRDIFTHTAIWNGGSYELMELSSGQVGSWSVDMFVGHVYRFQVINWPALLIQLCVIAISFFLTGIKFARLLFELAYKRLITNLIAILSFSNVSKLKKLISDLGNTFLVLFSIVLFFRMYGNFLIWLSTLSVHLFVYLFLVIGASLSLLDGPVFVQKLTGIDAGISSDGLKVANITRHLISGTGNMFHPVEKNVDKASGYASEESGFEMPKTEAQTDLLKELRHTSSKTFGVDLATDKLNQNSAEFGKSSKHDTLDVNYNENNQYVTKSFNNAINDDSIMKKDHLTVHDDQMSLETNAHEAIEHQNLVKQEQLRYSKHNNTTQQQPRLVEHKFADYKVNDHESYYASDELRDNVATDWEFPTKAKTNSGIQTSIKTSNKYNNEEPLLQTNFSQPSFQKQQKALEGLNVQNRTNSSQLKQPIIKVENVEIRKENNYVSDTKRNSKCNKARS